MTSAVSPSTAALGWIDTHCHLDAPEFAQDLARVQDSAKRHAVKLCVVPTVMLAHAQTVHSLAHTGGHAYGVGLHPLFVPQVPEGSWGDLAKVLESHAADPRCVAVGEIGLDGFVPTLQEPVWRTRQEGAFRDQLELAYAYGLPVILHSRRAVDGVLKNLRAVARMGKGHAAGWSGIAHAFNGSLQQAHALIDMGFKLGFGGALTYERSLQLRRLAVQLPLDALVLETDAPDIPPTWLYVPAEQRAQGQPQGRNEPAELPRIAQTLADLRGMALDELAHATTQNAIAALPKLRRLLQ